MIPAKHEKLIAARVGACTGIRFVKNEQRIIKRSPNACFVLTSQYVSPRKLRTLSKINILITKGSRNLKEKVFRA